jgi:hypothetical protein
LILECGSSLAQAHEFYNLREYTWWKGETSGMVATSCSCLKPSKLSKMRHDSLNTNELPTVILHTATINHKDSSVNYASLIVKRHCSW